MHFKYIFTKTLKQQMANTQQYILSTNPQSGYQKKSPFVSQVKYVLGLKEKKIFNLSHKARPNYATYNRHTNNRERLKLKG